eukprot:9286370-Pyramimonas_sp.AAC.1
MQGLVLTNTMFKKHTGDYVTHIGPGIPRQINYIMVDMSFWCTVRDSVAGRVIDMGSDHRTVHLRIAITRPATAPSTTTPARPKQRKCRKKSWPPPNQQTFANTVGDDINGMGILDGLSRRCTQIEDMLNAAFASCQEAPAQSNDQPHETREQPILHAMLDERRDIPREDTTRRNAATKRIRRD